MGVIQCGEFRINGGGYAPFTEGVMIFFAPSEFKRKELVPMRNQKAPLLYVCYIRRLIRLYSNSSRYCCVVYKQKAIKYITKKRNKHGFVLVVDINMLEKALHFYVQFVDMIKHTLKYYANIIK